jgi:predicted RNA binding protein YcfA (HicA-like mRNA interferase family)
VRWQKFTALVKQAHPEKGAAMPRLPSIKPKMVIRALKRNGFLVHHTSGSHYFLKKDQLRVSVPYHNKDLKRGTLTSIIAQAGLSVEEFVDLL